MRDAPFGSSRPLAPLGWRSRGQSLRPLTFSCRRVGTVFQLQAVRRLAEVTHAIARRRIHRLTPRSEPLPRSPGLGTSGPRLKTPSVVPGAPGETPRTQSRMPSKFDRLKLIRTLWLGFLHDTATTVPRRPPGLLDPDRCCHRSRRARCVQPTSATRIIKDEHPCDRCLPVR